MPKLQVTRFSVREASPEIRMLGSCASIGERDRHTRNQMVELCSSIGESEALRDNLSNP